jgi:hypothetical protein
VFKAGTGLLLYPVQAPGVVFKKSSVCAPQTLVNAVTAAVKMLPIFIGIQLKSRLVLVNPYGQAFIVFN